MKKISIVFLSFILCVLLCSCSGAKVKDANTTTENTSVSDVSSAQVVENKTTTTSVDVSNSKKSDVIQNNTTTTIKKKNKKTNNNSNQDTTIHDNIHVNAKDLVGGNYFD